MKQKREKAWQQVDHNSSLRGLFRDAISRMKEFKGHILKSDYNIFSTQKIAKYLSQNHAIVYANF